MRPYWLFFVALAIVLAFWGTKHRNVGFKESADDEFDKKSNGELFKITLPAIFLLFAVIFGPIVNDLVVLPSLRHLYMILTLVLIFLCTDFSMNKSVEAMVDGSTYILTRLFQVGIFLAFINVIAQTGTFAVIAGVAENAPAFCRASCHFNRDFNWDSSWGLRRFCFNFSATSCCIVELPPLALGFVAMGVGLGSQMSFVNITMQALSSGFKFNFGCC